MRIFLATVVWVSGCLVGRAQVQTRDQAPIDLDIPVFSGGYGIAFYEETARLFEKERPDVRVKLYGDPRIEDKLRVRIIDGNYPDAALSGLILWPAVIRAGKVLDLTAHLDGLSWEQDVAWKDTFQPGALDGWRIEGRTYGVPLTYACWTLFYNKALFRAKGWSEPRTWDEFFDLCAKIRETGLAPVALPGTRWLYANAFLRSAYYNLAGRDGWHRLHALEPGAWKDPRYVRAAAVLQRIAQHYTQKGWEGETHTGAQQAFFQGRAAMTVAGTWLVNEARGKTPPDFELGTMNFPVFAEGVAPTSTIQTGSDHFFAFATGDARRERATIDFLRFLTSRQRALDFVRQVDAPVAVRGVPVAEYSSALQDTARLVENAKEAFNMPQRMMLPPAIRQMMVDQQMLLMKGSITPEAFAASLEEAAERDRHRLANPDHVEVRHPLAASLLLLGLTSVPAWLLARRWWTRQAREARKQGKAAEARSLYFGPMRWKLAAGFVGPAFLLYAGLMLAPGLVSFGWSTVRWDGLSEPTWAGAFNFKWLLLETDLFWNALRNNVYLVIVPALVVLPLALGLAYLLHRGVLGAKAFRAIFLFPNLLGGIAATLLWMNAYQPHGGLVNAGLVGLGDALDLDTLKAFAGHPWLSQQNLYVALVPIYIWMACGFNMVLYLAAMEGIDVQLYEAAEIDGATPVRQFFSVTLPMIWEVILVSAVFLVIGGLNAFEMIWLLTSQMPDGSTHTLGTLLVTSMFQEFQIGRATALAVVLFVLVLVCSALVLRGLKREAVE